ncbi:UNVERIFIED_CONTAM: hypothetical protein Sangu_2904500 [Sesamum angustifolium]|uniref:Uncharacterized protein n=1 Tax=Sesamum angustifolium TaxID=2727405 RepID=A0AAW2INQ9_9LAMI
MLAYIINPLGEGLGGHIASFPQTVPNDAACNSTDALLCEVLSAPASYEPHDFVLKRRSLGRRVKVSPGLGFFKSGREARYFFKSSNVA